MRNNIVMLPPLLLAAVVFDSARIVAGSHRRLDHEEKITDTGKSDSLRYYKQTEEEARKRTAIGTCRKIITRKGDDIFWLVANHFLGVRWREQKWGKKITAEARQEEPGGGKTPRTNKQSTRD